VSSLLNGIRVAAFAWYTASKFALFSVSGLKDEKLIKKQTYMETETCKLYSRDFWIFLPNIIKIDRYNFELYRFIVGAFFETQCRLCWVCVKLCSNSNCWQWLLWQQVICKVAKGTKDDVDVAVEAAHVSLIILHQEFFNVTQVLSKLQGPRRKVVEILTLVET